MERSRCYRRYFTLHLILNIDVQVSGLAAGTPLTVVTESSNLNIRQEPSTEAAVVGKAAKGEIVTLVRTNFWRVVESFYQRWRKKVMLILDI